MQPPSNPDTVTEPGFLLNCLPLSLIGLGDVAASTLGFDPWHTHYEFDETTPGTTYTAADRGDPDWEAEGDYTEIQLREDQWFHPTGFVSEHGRDIYAPVLPLNPVGVTIALRWLAERCGCPADRLEAADFLLFRKLPRSKKTENDYRWHDAWVLRIMTMGEVAGWEFVFYGSQWSEVPAGTNGVICPEIENVSAPHMKMAVAVVCQLLPKLLEDRKQSPTPAAPQADGS